MSEDGLMTEKLSVTDSVLSPLVLQSEPDTLRRARFLAFVVASVAVVSACYAFLHLSQGSPVQSAFVAASIVPVLLTLALMRRPERLTLATHYLLTVILATIIISPLLSRALPHVFLGAIVVPFIAVSAIGSRAGLFWTPIVGLVLGLNATFLDLSPSERTVTWNCLLVAVAMGIGTTLLDGSRQRAKRQASEFSEQVDRQKAQRLEAEEALESSRILFAKAFEVSPTMLILSDLATGKILDVNESFVRLSGWQVDEAVGKSLSELGAWAATEDRDRLLEHILQNQKTPGVEIRLRTKSGADIWLLASAEILELEGRAHVMAQGIDITERKRGEEALARYRRLLEERVEESSERLRASHVRLEQQQHLAAVGTLAAGIAHQINNPIGAIMAAAEFALLADEDPDREAHRTRALRTTVEEARRCGRIVQNVLKFSRQEPTAKWVEDMNDIVRRAAELTRPYIRQCGGALDIQLEKAAMPVRVSPIDLEQVLVNVLRNSAESREDGARIGLSTRRDGEGMSIEITDDGDGIDLEDRDHVFDPFFTTRLEEGGSGLGLSVARGIVIDHGGTLEFDHQPEKGTRVIVRLPLHLGEP